MSLLKMSVLLREPSCFNCGIDARGRQLITINEAAGCCGVSVTTIYRWMNQGKIEWLYNAGRKRRIYKESLIRPECDRPHDWEPGQSAANKRRLSPRRFEEVRCYVCGAPSEQERILVNVVAAMRISRVSSATLYRWMAACFRRAQ